MTTSPASFLAVFPLHSPKLPRIEWTLNRSRILDSIDQHRRLILIFLLVNAIDSLTTIIGLGLGYTERNPMQAALIANSWGLSYLVKYAGVGLVVAISAIMFLSTMLMLRVLTAIIAVVVLGNLLVAL